MAWQRLASSLVSACLAPCLLVRIFTSLEAAVLPCAFFKDTSLARPFLTHRVSVLLGQVMTKGAVQGTLCDGQGMDFKIPLVRSLPLTALSLMLPFPLAASGKGSIATRDSPHIHLGHGVSKQGAFCDNRQ